MAISTGVDLLELRSRRELPIDLPDSGRKITVTLPLLPGAPDALWNRFTSKLRTKIRRSAKEGIEVRFGPDQIAAYFEVFRRHMRDLGTPTLPRRLFETIGSVFPESCWFAAAYFEGRPIAAGCALLWGTEIEMTWSAGLQEFNRLRPNMWLYWSVMERACREGLETFNFGRCSPGSGTHAFKSSWTGATDERLFWYFLSSSDRSSTPTPDSPGLALGPRVWKRVPLPVATALGPSIVRFIP
jgi:hypothetical protein